MSESIVKAIGRATKTMAMLSAVVFLLFAANGCACSSACRTESEPGEKVQRRTPRKRAHEYSRIPNNYPATWQRATIGN